ncbi:hypothetical protein [Sedimenticola sp.]|uniref:hypothetical protein n=1 Tax=Sedimenticola sp. TaxID=1940285 RepID=UPI00258DF318|nr:hypothetical protein [Sedimenticola sp.]MCW8902647.1 hypothetical protein [Sedimenticola sp.]
MVSPISNDKLLPQNSDRNGTATSKRSSGEQSGAPNTAITRPTDDTVELSSTSRLANQEISSTKNSGAINSEAEARDLVIRIREQIESAGSQAMKSHGQLEKGGLTSLLESSAA